MKFSASKPFVLIMLAEAIFCLPAGAALNSGAQPKIVVHDSGTAISDNITLGDVATITPSPTSSKLGAKLAATVLGNAPLAGQTRLLNRGDIMLKLREAGINPDKMDIEGASNISVTDSPAIITASAQQAPLDATTNAADVVPTAPPVSTAPAVKSGDPVDVVLVDGPVTVHAQANAISGGSIGDRITIERDGALHSLSAIIIGADQVQLEE